MLSASILYTGTLMKKQQLAGDVTGISYFHLISLV